MQNIEGVHLALWSQLGTRLKGAFKEGVHLWRVHLEGFLCILKYKIKSKNYLVKIFRSFRMGSEHIIN